MFVLIKCKTTNWLDAERSKVCDIPKNGYCLLMSSKKKHADVQNTSIKIGNFSDDITILYEWIAPPKFRVRKDNDIKDILIKGRTLRALFDRDTPLHTITPYKIVSEIFNHNKAYSISSLCWGKTNDEPSFHDSKCSVIVPHKGDISEISRCLSYLNIATKNSDNEILIGYDNSSKCRTIHSKIRHFINTTGDCIGPYRIRNYLVEKTQNDIVIFQDSDDISLKNRVSKIIYNYNSIDSDIIGSHELRLDVLQNRLYVVRYPLDVNLSLENHPYHAQLHPTTAINKKSFINSGGFSEKYVHSMDTLFLLRSSLLGLRIRNIDEVLYIRKVGKSSLTTSVSTGWFSPERINIQNNWRSDFYAVKKQKVEIDKTVFKAPFRKQPSTEELMEEV